MRIEDSQPFVPLILGGDIGAYSLAREFHEAYGVRSVAIPSVMTGLLAHSRIVEPRVFADHADEAGLLAFIEAQARGLSLNGTRRVLLLASNDPHTRLIVEHRERFKTWATVPYADLTPLLAVTTKEGFDALCAEHGVPTPATAVVHAGEDGPAAARAAGVGYPAIVKASDSVAWHDVEFPGQKKVHTVASEAELTALAAAAEGAGYTAGLVVQDLIPGPDSGMHLVTFFADRAGNVRFGSAGRVVVEEHAPGALGNSAAIVSGAYPEIVETGRRVLQDLGWRGFAMFDLKFDPRDGSYRFFELNPRLGRNHFYVTAAGHNVARFYVEEFLEGGLKQSEDFVHATNEHLYSVLPQSLLRRYVPADLHPTIKRLFKRGGHSHPLVYRAETHPRRWFYIAASLVNQYRKFKRWHPAP
ncbi:MAG: hypothetical protein LBE25_10390 [Arthrobacter sp.]|jgi:D-aspartate ligase|nr:hypothetical protein [Arthrobacter sp.]